MNSFSLILTTILKYAYTRVEAEKLLSVFRLISEAYFYQQADTAALESLVRNQFRHSTDVAYCLEALSELIKLVEESSKGRIYETMHEASEALEQLPVLTLYVPMKFEHADIKRIGTWVRSNLHEKILIQFIINANYRGGCGISWQGVMKDYSFNHFLQRESRSIQTLIQNV